MPNKIPFWKCILVAAVFLVTLGCEKEAPKPVEPVRPSNIPANSLWVGGIDGGVFVLIAKSKKSEKDMYQGEIYYVSGDAAYKGPMKIFPAGSSFEISEKGSYEGWDGDTLYLSNNRYLKVKE